MALGFTDLTSTRRIPDRGLTKKTTPRTFTVEFGDGYEQRIARGINNLAEEFSIAFTNRPVADIDDIIAFFDSKAGVTAFDFTIPDTNESGNEVTIKVVCETWNKVYFKDNFYNATATFRRVYES